MRLTLIRASNELRSSAMLDRYDSRAASGPIVAECARRSCLGSRGPRSSGGATATSSRLAVGDLTAGRVCRPMRVAVIPSFFTGSRAAEFSDRFLVLSKVVLTDDLQSQSVFDIMDTINRSSQVSPATLPKFILSSTSIIRYLI
eukprot:SAG31_NODE_5258_length_2647_cov_1.622841_4_plen_144_part_00